MKRLLPLFLALGLLSMQAPAQIVKKGGGYLFRMKFTKGAVIRYKVNSTAEGLGANGQGMKITLPMVWKVKNVQGGVAVIEATVGPVTVGKQTMLQPTTNTVKIDGRGKSVGEASTGQQITPTFPLNPIKVGTSWTASMPIQGAAGQQRDVSATYKFAGIKTVNGKQVAHLLISTSGQARGSGYMQLLLSDGSLFSSHLKMTVKVDMPDGKVVSRNMTADIHRS